MPDRGLPRWLSGKEFTCQCRRHRRCGFDSWVGKIPWRRKWQPTPVFLPEKFHGPRSLVGCSPLGCRVGHDWAISLHFFTSCSHSLFMRLLKGKSGKKIDHLLITYSSFLLLWSKGKVNKLGKVFCDQKIWKLCLGQTWVECESVWFKVSHNIALLRWREKTGFLLRVVSCKQLLTSSSHQISFLWNGGISVGWGWRYILCSC